MRNMDIDSGCSGIRMRDRDIVLYSNLKESAAPRNCLMFRGSALFLYNGNARSASSGSPDRICICLKSADPYADAFFLILSAAFLNRGKYSY
jgi:hypothetical protein